MLKVGQFTFINSRTDSNKLVAWTKGNAGLFLSLDCFAYRHRDLRQRIFVW